MEVVDKTIEAGVRELRRHQVLLTREQWLKEAERCESEGSPRTCEAIVKATVAMELEDEDRLDTWVGDAESAEAKGMVSTSRAILSYALKVYPDRRNLWRKAADLEKNHGTRSVAVLRIYIFTDSIFEQGKFRCHSRLSRGALPTSRSSMVDGCQREMASK